jgi:ankyrin repeat protein
MLLSLSFSVREENEGDEDESDQGVWIYDVNEEDSEGDAPLLLACRSGSLEIAEILVVAGAGVSAANYQGDTPLLAAVGAGKFELAEMLVSKAKADVIVINGDGASALHLVIASDNARSFEMFEALLKAEADVNVVRRDGASGLALAIVSGNARILNCRMMPKMIEHAESAEISYVRRLSLAFLEPNNIFRWLKDG